MGLHASKLPLLHSLWDECRIRDLSIHVVIINYHIYWYCFGSSKLDTFYEEKIKHSG